MIVNEALMFHFLNCLEYLVFFIKRRNGRSRCSETK